jgi:2,4-dienoyl-CoA reductase-like NADH-dependent reductase (Old Yellow Enzyme family)/thioredoxin reductase
VDAGESCPSYPHLFTPLTIRTMRLPNRIVMPAMATNFASETGGVTPWMLSYYEARARGGTGLVVIENCTIEYPRGKNGAVQLRLDDDAFIPGLAQLVDRIHRHGACAALQINHCGASTSRAKTGQAPVAPSPVTYVKGQEVPRELTLEEIADLVEKFGRAAARAKKAGFDAVEVHGAHAYLIAQFLSPFTNRRTDGYGGSPEGRLRFALEVLALVREAVGPGFPIIFRISADEFLEGGRELRGTLELVPILEAAGVDCWDVSAGTSVGHHPSGTRSIEPMGYPQAWRTYMAKAVREVARVPVIAVGVIREPAVAEAVLSRGDADLVAIGRGLIADPEWPGKAREGREREIRRCTSCNQGCIRRRVFMDLPITCALNPAVGREDEAPETRPAAIQRRVMVVGGGPGGMEAARVVAIRGHAVVLWEEHPALGGELPAAMAAPKKEKIGWVLEYYRHELSRLGVSVRLGKRVDPEVVAAEAPDVVILATGSRPIRPPVPGVDADHVAAAVDVLVGEIPLAEGRIVIVGGGQIGCETALFAAARGRHVSLLEMLPAIATDMEVISRNEMLEHIAGVGVVIKAGHRVTAILPDAVVARDGDGLEAAFPADQVLLAVGLTPRTDLEPPLRGQGIECYPVGDCVQVREILSAVREAYDTALRI